MAKWQAGRRGVAKVQYLAQPAGVPRPLPRGSLSRLAEPGPDGEPPSIEVMPGIRLSVHWAVGFGMGFCVPGVVFRMGGRLPPVLPAAYIRTRRHWELPGEAAGMPSILTESGMAERLALACTPLACEALSPCAILPFVQECWDATVRRAVMALAEDFGEVLDPDEVAVIWAERAAAEVHRE